MDIERWEHLRSMVLTQEILDLDYNDARDMLIEAIDKAIASQSVTNEAVREAIEFQEKYAKSCQESIEQLERGDVNYIESSMEDGKWTNKCINDDIIAREKREIFLHNLAITALQAYQPWVPVSESMAIESDLRNGMVLAWSTELCEWQVENWGYVEDRPDDYTHWKSLPEPPKGE